MQTAEKNRLGTAPIAVRERIQAHLVWLQQELETLDEDLHRQGSPAQAPTAKGRT